jgi:hypothetical protein
MGSAAKKSLYDLVDRLPDSEVPAAQRYLEFLHTQADDPYSHLDGQDPFETMPEDECVRLHAALDQAEKEFAAGKGIPAEIVLRELRSR